MTPAWLTFAQEASLPALSLAALLLAVIAAIKVWPQLRQMQIESDSSLRGVLMGRVNELETRVADLERLLAKEQASHAVEISDLQHDLRNETACLDAFLLLAEANPDNVLEHIPRIKEMRERHKQRVALKVGAREGQLMQEVEV